MALEVSIVIPCYNRASAIGATLKSVQAQTFADFECIVVDDGSADGEALEAAVAALGDSRFRLVRRKNGGGGAARNTGVDHARGRLIAFLDSDDCYLPEKLGESRSLLAELQDPSGVVFSQVVVDRGEGKYWVKPPRAPGKGERIDEYLICGNGFIQTSTIVMESELARYVRFDESLPFGQDTDFCIRLAAAGARFLMLPEPMVVWKDHWSEGRVSSNPKYQALLRWTDAPGSAIGRKARLAYRGWHIAKAARVHSPLLSLRLYIEGLLGGAYSPKLAVRVGLQVLLPRRIYRHMADAVIVLCGLRKS